MSDRTERRVRSGVPGRASAERVLHTLLPDRLGVLTTAAARFFGAFRRYAGPSSAWTWRCAIDYSAPSELCEKRHGPWTLPARQPELPTPDQEPVPPDADEVPWSGRLAEYDIRHHETYVRLLDADNDGLSQDDMARRVLGIDPAAEPERARKAVEIHLARARWMGEVSYRYLAAADYPGGEDLLAEQL